MADDGSEQSTPVWPLSKFYFEICWDDAVMHFQEVSGLDVEPEPVRYRAGNAPAFSKIKMPGMTRSGNITMKKGMVKTGDALSDWFNEIKKNVIKRKKLTISLLDEKGSPTMIWEIENAFPVKLSGTDLNAEGSEVAIETVEFAHEGIAIANV